MNQTNQREPGSAAAESGARKGWELFWRTIAGLILLVIAWVAWVAYQIMPRPIVTPLAYASPVRPISMQPAAPTAEAAPAAAQAAAGDPAATAESREAPIRAQGLRLATEISALPADERIAGTPESKPGAVAANPATARAAGKDRP